MSQKGSRNPFSQALYAFPRFLSGSPCFLCFSWFPIRFLLGFPWFPIRFPFFPLSFPWFPIRFHWFSVGFPWLPMSSHWFPSCPCLPISFAWIPMCFPWLPMGCPWFPYWASPGFCVGFAWFPKSPDLAAGQRWQTPPGAQAPCCGRRRAASCAGEARSEAERRALGAAVASWVGRV